MKYLHHYSSLLLAISLPVAALAQSVTLQEVTVQSNRINQFSSGIKTEVIDSAIIATYQNSTLTDLLAEQSPVFVKNYGSGGLATSSFRGAGAGHTAVVWNGFNLQSPLNGQIDFSLLPVTAADNITLQYGGTGALWGSGAVGGVIHLQNQTTFNKGLRAGVQLSGGSFGRQQQSVQLSYGTAKVSLSTKGYRQYAENDFTFYNTAKESTPLQRQIHAQSQVLGFMQQADMQLSAKQQVGVTYWYQQADRNLPPTMAQLISQAKQQDVFHRVFATYKHTARRSIVFVRSAYFSELLNFTDSASAIYSDNRAYTTIGETELRYSIATNHTVTAGINYTYAQAISNGFAAQQHQQRAAVFAAYTLIAFTNRLKASVSARKEWITQQQGAFTYAAGAEYALAKTITIKGNIAKVYRVPTFNDLYWTPGGNPNLVPEDGFSEDVGMKIMLINTAKTALSFEPTVFNRNVNNWIIWLPETFYWSPTNIMQVWSRGVETKSAFSYLHKKWLLKVQVFTNYVRSTNSRLKTIGDASLGKQLIYVPIYSAQATFTLQYATWSLLYNHTYTGYTYSATDHSAYLLPYYLVNARLTKRFAVKKQTLAAFAAVNNAFNTRYQVLVNRAMPLRNYQFGISYHLN